MILAVALIDYGVRIDLNAEMDLKTHYQGYIDKLNGELTAGCLDPYIEDGIVFNDSGKLSVADCVHNVQEVQAILPGLHFDVEWIVVEKDPGSQGEQGFANVAVRARVSYNSALGKEITFTEHVFYRFEAGKIARGKSIVDVLQVPEKDQWAAKKL